MNINCMKTKEMIFCPLRKQPPPPLLISNQNVEQVTSFKLLGVTINNSLKWDDHIAAVTSKAAKRLWFLKKLKRAGVSQADLIYLLLSSCYQTCTRICVPCFAYKHYRSTVEEIGLNLSNYSSRQANDACTLLGLSSLHERRQEQCQKLFQQLACSTDNCLHYLLPGMRDPTITNSLRHANKYPSIFAKTTKFKNSFIIISSSSFILNQATRPIKTIDREQTGIHRICCIYIYIQ